MAVRIISALVALPIVLFLIYTGGWPFTALVVVVGAIVGSELAGMTIPGDAAAKVLHTALVGGTVLAVMIGAGARPQTIPIAGLILIAILVFFLFRPEPIDTVGERIGYTLLALAWGGLLLGAIGILRLLPEGAAWVVQACILAWASDTGAYFAGRFLGKHKLYEKVSPKKTWEGAVGGAVVATIAAVVFARAVGPSSIPIRQLIVIAPLGAALGQLGDLAESLLKRAVGVKDSGTIMPGHGGLFDRIDALLFTGAWLLAYAIGVLGLSPEWLRLP